MSAYTPPNLIDAAGLRRKAGVDIGCGNPGCADCYEPKPPQSWIVPPSRLEAQPHTRPVQAHDCVSSARLGSIPAVPRAEHQLYLAELRAEVRTWLANIEEAQQEAAQDASDRA